MEKWKSEKRFAQQVNFLFIAPNVGSKWRESLSFQNEFGWVVVVFLHNQTYFLKPEEYKDTI